MNSEQLQRWALTAEIVGGVAVVLTLIFLVIETRENTNAIRAQTYQNLMVELNDWRELNRGSTEARRILTIFYESGFDSLSPDEQMAFGNNEVILWSIYENAYIANYRGMLGEIEWSRFENSICREYSRRSEMWSNNRPLFIVEFADFVENLCQ